MGSAVERYLQAKEDPPESAVERYRKAAAAKKPVAPASDDHGIVSNIGRGLATGAAKTGTSTIRLAGRVLGWLPGDRAARDSERIKQFANEQEDQAQSFYDAQGTAGTVGEVAGRIIGEGATTVLGGMGLAKVLPKVLPAGSKLAQAYQAGRSGTYAQRLAVNATAAPIDYAMGYGGARNDEDAVKEGLLSAGLGQIGSAALEGLANPGARRLRATNVLNEAGVAKGGIRRRPARPGPNMAPATMPDAPQSAVEQFIQARDYFVNQRGVQEAGKVRRLGPRQDVPLPEGGIEPPSTVLGPASTPPDIAEISPVVSARKGIRTDRAPLTRLPDDPRELLRARQAEQFGVRPEAITEIRRRPGPGSVSIDPGHNVSPEVAPTDATARRMLTGRELGDESVPTPELRERARSFAYDQFREKDFVNQETERSIRVNRRGIDHTLRHAQDDVLGRIHAQSVPALDQLLEDATLLGTEAPKVGADRGTHAVHRFEKPVTIDGQPYSAHLVVKEAPDGHFFYDHKLTTIEPAVPPDAPFHQSQDGGGVGDAAGSQGNVPPAIESSKQAPKDSDVLNVAKLNLADRTAEQRMAQKLEEYRSLKASQVQTWDDADIPRAEIFKELSAGDPLSFDLKKAQKLSGEELLARRDLVAQNDQLISELSRQIESKALPLAAHEQAVELLEKAYQQNDVLLKDLVVGSSQKGRDLNMLRRIANRTLDPTVWMTQAKRILGDRPMTDEIQDTIRRLAKEAEDVCGGG